MATRNSIVHGRKFYDVLCLPLPLPPWCLPLPLPASFQERHENFCGYKCKQTVERNEE